MFRIKRLSVRDPNDVIQEEKNYRERSNIKSARVGALRGSVPRKMANAAEGFSTMQESNPCLQTMNKQS